MAYINSMNVVQTYHFVTLLVKWTGLWAEIDSGSALAIERLYMSENLGNFEEITRPVLLKEPCRKYYQRYKNDGNKCNEHECKSQWTSVHH